MKNNVKSTETASKETNMLLHDLAMIIDYCRDYGPIKFFEHGFSQIEDKEITEAWLNFETAENSFDVGRGSFEEAQVAWSKLEKAIENSKATAEVIEARARLEIFLGSPEEIRVQLQALVVIFMDGTQAKAKAKAALDSPEKTPAELKATVQELLLKDMAVAREQLKCFLILKDKNTDPDKPRRH